MSTQAKSNVAIRAKIHTQTMDQLYWDLTELSSEETFEYTGTGVYNLSPSSRYNKTIFEIQNVTTSQAIDNNQLEGKTAVLNFASYKNPGGGFLRGSMAQEEAICHDSNLYNILEKWTSAYYEWNREHLNHGLYMDRALYTPKVQFTCNKQVDVLTCAAPNLSPVQRYNSVGFETVAKAQISRVAFMCSVLLKQQVDTAILGAWGCGVFKNDPYVIAYLMMYFINKMNGHLKTVIFAVPDAKFKQNYQAFSKAVQDYKSLEKIPSVKVILPVLKEYEKYL